MAKRYTRILGAAKYYSAIDNYLKYITDATKRGSRVGTGQERPPSKILYVTPFSQDLAASQYARVSGSSPAHLAYKAVVNTGKTRVFDALTAGTKSIKIDRFKPARVIIVTGRSAKGVVDTSNVTGMKYLKYGGKSTSVPFGRGDAAEDIVNAFNAIKAAIPAAAGTKVTLQQEDVT